MNRALSEVLDFADPEEAIGEKVSLEAIPLKLPE